MSWKSDKERAQTQTRKRQEENQRQRDLHDAFWGRLKQPEQPKEKQNGN